MAVNDSINVYTNGATTFVPASGVEILVLSVFVNGGDDNIGFTNGTNAAKNYYYGGSPSAPWVNRFMITNTDYYVTDSPIAGTGFAGIQTK